MIRTFSRWGPSALSLILLSTPALAFDDTVPALELRAVASGPRQLSFEGNEVVLSEVWEEDTVWLSAARELRGTSARYVYRDLVTLPDPTTGTTRVELGREVPRQSVWIAINDGEVIVATPSGFPLREVPFPEASLFPGRPSEPDFIVDSRRALTLMVVRPDKGAWLALVGDGTLQDADGLRDGRITLSLDIMRPVGESREMEPDKFLPHDIVIGIDAFSFEFYAAEVQEVWQEEE